MAVDGGQTLHLKLIFGDALRQPGIYAVLCHLNGFAKTYLRCRIKCLKYLRNTHTSASLSFETCGNVFGN